METTDQQTRRHFIGSLSCLVLGVKTVKQTLVQGIEEKKFGDPFDHKEKKVIEQSAMANDIKEIPGHGYSCAESIFLASLRAIGESEARVHSAAAFGGGMGRGDLCGLLTGGLMAIGVAGGKLYRDSKEMHEWVRDVSNIYWEWFETHGPVHCHNLTAQYEGREAYLRMCRRVAVKIESLIGPAIQ